MSTLNILSSPEAFSESLYEKLKRVSPGIGELELYEFRYALDNLYPENGGWASVKLDPVPDIEQRVNTRDFYTGIQLKPQVNGKIVLDANILRLTNMLLVGLVTGAYSEEWIRARFYFDVRGFFFLVRTTYFTDAVLAHLGGKPWKSFEPKQKRFEQLQSIGYKDFMEANAEVDQVFIECVKRLIAVKGTPMLIAIAGPTAAGKTEIVARLRSSLEQAGKSVTSIEMDNFLTDRDYREEEGIDSLGRQAIHLDLFRQSLQVVTQGGKTTIPRYDFVYATSSHDLDGKLKEGGIPVEIEPAEIVFVEGNFPFLLNEVVDLIGVKAVYLTDDPVRLKRKWKRDVDYRRKYEPTYLCNRFFKDQFLMAQECYRPQMQTCDLAVDTTGAAIWATPEIAEIVGQE